MKTPSRQTLALCFAWALLLGAFLALFLPALSFPYQFDDLSNVIMNRAIRYWGHWRIFFESEYARSRPLTNLSFALSYLYSGLSLSALRAPSLLLHLVNATFVALFFRRWLGSGSASVVGAVFAGGVFLLHPLAGESVIYLTARSSLLVLCFLFAAFWLQGKSHQGVWSWIGFCLFSAGAFLSKESAVVMLPLLLVVHWRERRRAQELLPYLLPFLIGVLVHLVLKISYLDHAWRGYFQIQDDVDIHSFADYLRLSLSLWPRILTHFFRPDLLAIDHQIFLPESWLALPVMVGIFIWLGFGAAAIWFIRKRSLPAFFVLWILLSLSATNTIFPVLDPFSERHFYLALPGFAWLCGYLCFRLVGARERVWILGPAVAVLLLLGFTFTRARIEDWRSPRALWASASRLYPNKFRITFNAWRAFVVETGEEMRGLEMLVNFLRALPPGALKYESQDMVTNLMGNVLSARGGAKQTLAAVATLGDAPFWLDLALLKALIGREPDSFWRERWRKSLARSSSLPIDPLAKDPDFVRHSFLLLRARFERERGHMKAALADYEEVFRAFALDENPFWKSRSELGAVYEALGRESDALHEYELTVKQYKMFKQFPLDLHRKLYAIYRKRGDLVRASDALGELVRVQTDHPELRQEYAEVLKALRSQNAPQQAAEADFYAREGIRSLDEREMVKP